MCAAKPGDEPCYNTAMTARPLLLGGIVGLLVFSFLPFLAHAAIVVQSSGAAECLGNNTCNDSSPASGATFSGAEGGGSPQTFTYTFSVGASTNNGLLIVSVETSEGGGVCTDDNGFGAATTSSITYDGEALTEIGRDKDTAGCTPPSYGNVMDEWYLVNPPTGSHNLVVTLSSSGMSTTASIVSTFGVLTGVNQSTPIRDINASGAGDTPGLSASTTVSSATYDVVWDSVCGGGSIDSTTDVPQVILNVDDSTGCNNTGASTKAGASSVTTNWAVNSLDGGDNWIDFASSIEPATTPLTKVVFLTSGTSWTVPSDWNSANNTIECIGGGGGGGGNDGTDNGGGGGGGGEYREVSDTAYTSGNSITIQIGAGGGGSNTTGANGTASFIENNSNASNVCNANPGGGGGYPTTDPASGGAGGTGGTGTVGFSGGAGGFEYILSGDTAGGGGGGAGGPYGIGGAGAADDNSSTGPGGGANGGGGAGTFVYADTTGQPGGNSLWAAGGAGGTSGAGTAGTEGSGGGGGYAVTTGTGGNGGAGIDWNASHGSGGGGGGGGGSATASANGGNGGLYGGGGGGGGSPGSATGGNDTQGIIVISYNPVSTSIITPPSMVEFWGGSYTQTGGSFYIF